MTAPAAHALRGRRPRSAALVSMLAMGVAALVAPGLAVPAARAQAAGTAPAAPATPAPATPAPDPGQARSPASEREHHLRQLWAEIQALLGQASEARLPPLVPPTPVAVRWSARRAASILLDAPLLALAAGDLDGDGRDELIALTATEVVVIGRDGRALVPRARTPLPADPAPLRPRDPVGVLVVQRAGGAAELAVRTSEQARGARLALRDNALVVLGPIDDFPLCTGVHARLAPGRNYFEGMATPADAAGAHRPAHGPGTPAGALAPPLPERFLAARCSQGLVDPAGRPLEVAGAVATDGTLRLAARAHCRAGDAPCPPPRTTTHARAGTAIAIADLDRDGRPEIALAQAAAPGDPDAVIVLSWTGDTLTPVFERRFSGGVVGLAAGDLDGDGATDLVGAVRLLGSNRVDLWMFND